MGQHRSKQCGVSAKSNFRRFIGRTSYAAAIVVFMSAI